MTVGQTTCAYSLPLATWSLGLRALWPNRTQISARSCIQVLLQCNLNTRYYHMRLDNTLRDFVIDLAGGRGSACCLASTARRTLYTSRWKHWPWLGNFGVLGVLVDWPGCVCCNTFHAFSRRASSLTITPISFRATTSGDRLEIMITISIAPATIFTDNLSGPELKPNPWSLLRIKRRARATLLCRRLHCVSHSSLSRCCVCLNRRTIV